MNHFLLVSLGAFAVGAASPAQSPSQVALPSPAFGTAGVVEAELAGTPTRRNPFWEFHKAFNQGGVVRASVAPAMHPILIGETVDLYVTANKDAAGWAANPALVDVSSGGAETVVVASTMKPNNWLVDSGTLNGAFSGILGVPYDLVMDVDQDGLLGPGDLIDGLGAEGGFYVISDVMAPGPHAVTEITYSGGSFLGQDTYYPTAIAGMGKLPLVVVSHGNGHNFTWYDHIGMHMASYGYVVMSHENNTGPGIETASTTTLSNTEYIIANQGTIGGGVLNNHIDADNIVWIGHSRGGEGICRAYDRIFDGTYIPVNFQIGDIKLLSSMAPTDFLGVNSANPHSANYSLWVAGGDSDVTGCANNDIAQSFHLHDRAEQTRLSISLHGVGHGDLHNGPGGAFFTGPCPVGKLDTNEIQQGYFLPMIEYFVRGSVPAKDFLFRHYERFQPPSAPIGNPCVVVDLQFREGNSSGKFVLDNFQTNPSTALSSSGGAVSFTVQNLTENRLDDNNADFTDNAGDPMNGMTMGNASDTTRGLVFSVDGAADYGLDFAVPPAAQDVTQWDQLSFRACQATRHPLTTIELADSFFNVTLRDSANQTVTLYLNTWQAGVEEPYQRTGCGIGAGWGNEFETHRIRFTDYLHSGVNLNLNQIVAIEFDFGPTLGTPPARFGLDDLEFVDY